MASSWQRVLMMTAGIFFAVFFMKNLFLKDYDGETNTFFKQIGREDMIPKTATDLRRERLQKQTQFEELLGNMTAMQAQMAAMRTELDLLQAARASSETHAGKGKVIE